MRVNSILQLLGTVKAAEQELLMAENTHIKGRVCEGRGAEAYLPLPLQGAPECQTSREQRAPVGHTTAGEFLEMLFS